MADYRGQAPLTIRQFRNAGQELGGCLMFRYLSQADIQKMQRRIEILLANGYKLVAEQNDDPMFRNEIYVGVVSPSGVWTQDLAIIRQTYSYNGGEKVNWIDDSFDVIVYGDVDCEDFTDEFKVGLYKGDA